MVSKRKKISPMAVRNVAHENDLKVYRPLAKPFLTKDQMEKRLEFGLLII